MPGLSGKNWIVCAAGPFIRLLVNGRYHTFEMHDFCGPMRLRTDFEPAKNQWSINSPFWPVFEKWMAAGQKIDEFGRGILI